MISPTRRAVLSSLFIGLAVATLIPLWSGAGWPLNHDAAGFAERTHIYARHFSWLDVIPIWSSADASGFGSPMPLMYHKLFYTIAAALTLVTGSIKFGDTSTVAGLLVVGAAGLYLTTRAIGGSRLAAAAAGCCLITANYTVTNWLVRGAVAEFSGAMLTAWVLYFSVRAIQTGRSSIGLGVTIGLLWLAHSVLAFYVVLILATIYLLLAVSRMAPWSVVNPRTLWPPVVCALVLIGPYLLPMAILGRGYDFDRILLPPMRPAYQFRPLSWYFWDQHWHFGRLVEMRLTLQLDLAMLALLAVALCVLIGRRPDEGPSARSRVLRPALPFLGILVVGLVLQTPIAAPFYAWFPGAAYIQFPWRLLALMTPALIVAAVYLADTALPRDASLFSLGAAVAWMVVACGAFVPLQDRRVSFDVVPLPDHLTFSMAREYEPSGAPPVEDTIPRIVAQWTNAGCSYDRLDPATAEVAVVTLLVRCATATTLPLPLYASPLHMVRSSTYDRGQRCLPIADFPALCGAVIPAAASRLAVTLPTMASLPAWAWEHVAQRR